MTQTAAARGAGAHTISISYDALTAHAAIIFVRYMMLIFEHQRNTGERSLGELFYVTMKDLHYLDV